MRKPRVVILSAFLSPFRSGAEACAEEIPRWLVTRYSITIVTARLRRDLPRRDFLPPLPNPPPEGEGIPVIRVGFGGSFDKWLFPFLAPFAVRRLKPDIVHAVLETFAGAALWGCRLLVPSAKRILTLQTTNRSFLKCPVIRAAHTVTAISSVLRETAKQCGREAQLIPNGVDYRAIREACARHPKITGRILFVGRLEKMKGVDTLLRAVSGERLAGRTDWSLRIVGSGSLREQLSAFPSATSSGPSGSFQLSASGRITFLGYLPAAEVYREYAEAEIFCALPRSEALGNVFLEAQAAGCAVVGARVGGVPEIVLHGKTGVLVSPDDPAAVADALVVFLKDKELRSRLSSAAVEHAVQYDWSGIAEKYAKVYSEPHRAALMQAGSALGQYRQR